MIACALAEQLEGAKQCSGRIKRNPEVIPRTASEVGFFSNLPRIARNLPEPRFSGTRYASQSPQQWDYLRIADNPGLIQKTRLK
jgi:hypothetical protein